MESIVNNSTDFLVYANEMLSYSFPNENVHILEAKRSGKEYVLRVSISGIELCAQADTGYDAICQIEIQYEYISKSINQ
ncbi:MAG: hypothetical protein LBS01_10430 [Prevotellaceae bacterium]|jgi:hypothetical protein|nr:hypothetical protein [Prevotellaceae bacterium]